jgi:4-alpha-glucanotransferase
MPLGTHREGYDVWRYQGLYALGAAGGAPPDPVFTQGQNWGFAPIHPERSREQGHAYWIAYLRHHLRYARMLRFDHVMGLHRLYWVPEGLPASEGAYVRYPAEEFYAVLCLESQRHQAVIVGENLGTVPPEVDGALARHGVTGMYVAQYEFRPPPRRPLRPIPRDVVAGVNTHDMPPFHAWFRGADLEDRQQLGLLTRANVQRERRLRRLIIAALRKSLPTSGGFVDNSSQAGILLWRLLKALAGSEARYLLLNLEDLWLEVLPQNVPGTSSERVNWRRRLRLSMEEVVKDPGVAAWLAAVRRRRRRQVSD